MLRIITIIIFVLNLISGQKILIPMDQTQNDHLKAYGIAYYVLKRNINVEWLLNFQGGSFLIDIDKIEKIASTAPAAPRR